MDRSLNPEQLLDNATWLRGLARSLVGDDARADDIVQQASLALLKAPPRHAPSAGAWLAQVVRNLARRSQREESRRRRREQLVARSEGLESPPEEVLERAELQRTLVDEVLKLSEPYRTTVLLRYFEDLSPGEIARRQLVPEKTVWTRLARAMERLRRRLDGRHGGDRSRWCGLLLPVVAKGPLLSPAGAALAPPVSLITLGGIIMAQKTLLTITLVGLLTLVAGIGVGRMFPSDPAGKRGASVSLEKYQDLEGRYDAVVAELAAAETARERAIAESEALTTRVSDLGEELEKIQATASAGAAESPTPLAVRFGPWSELDAFRDADWEEMAQAVETINALLSDLISRSEEGLGPEPDFRQKLQTENAKLVKFAAGVIGQIPTHSPVNGEFSHPLATANLMGALLDRSGRSLSARQTSRLTRQGEDFEDKYAEHQEAYDDTTLHLEKLLDELELKRDTVNAMQETLTEEQREAIINPDIHHRLQLDTLSPFVMAIAFAKPQAVASQAESVTKLKEYVVQQYSIDADRLEQAHHAFAAWSEQVMPIMKPVEMDQLSYLHLDDALIAGRAYQHLLQALSRTLDLDEKSRNAIQIELAWPVPRLVEGA